MCMCVCVCVCVCACVPCLFFIPSFLCIVQTSHARHCVNSKLVPKHSTTRHQHNTMWHITTDPDTPRHITTHPNTPQHGTSGYIHGHNLVSSLLQQHEMSHFCVSHHHLITCTIIPNRFLQCCLRWYFASVHVHLHFRMYPHAFDCQSHH